MNFTADEYCNMYLALDAAENNAAFNCTHISCVRLYHFYAHLRQNRSVIVK
jgi:hypothetical protein